MPGNSTEERKLAAIMFTDIVGYTALSQRNETLALELLEEHRRLLRPIFPKHQGTEIKTMGDGFLVQFNSALAAARCAIEIQKILFSRNASEPKERKIQIRIGIHVGDVVQREGDVLGDGVNIASRLQPLAEPGGICISVDVARQIRHNLEASVVTVGQAELKNVEMPLEVCRIVLPWETLGKAEGGRKNAETKTSVRPSPAWPLAGVGAIVLLAVGLGWWLVRQRGGSTVITNTVPVATSSAVPGRITSLAVRPFDDYASDTNNAYLSDGMTEALCAALGNIGALTVPGRSSVMRYKNSPKSIPEMAKELKVDAIVEGSVQRAGSRMKITVQLIDGVRDRHLWATNYDRDLSDFFTVQSEVARAVANEIQVRLTPEDQSRLTRARSVNPEAQEAYLKGRYQWNKRTEEGFRRAIEHFQQAIAKEPTYALAYAGLGDCYSWFPNYGGGPRDEWMPRARAAATKALELDPNFAEPHATLANVKLYFDSDLPGAKFEFDRAIELNPRYASAHQWYGWYWMIKGKLKEALAEKKRALELDPLSPIISVEVGLLHYFLHEYDRAIEILQQTIAMDRNFPRSHLFLARALQQIGRHDEAIAELKLWHTLSETSTANSAELGYAYALAGRRAEAEGILASLKDPGGIALVYTGLGNKDQALTWLEKRYQGKGDFFSFALLRVSPQYDSLRSDPRFDALAKKVGLEK
ncbi:MAG: tetratricopeptide repeat protein [Verrucomicrobia bacterium]|nr:tetratricopeptide repeat protein [Verrucomicrobiota bacterium]